MRVDFINDDFDLPAFVLETDQIQGWIELQNVSATLGHTEEHKSTVPRSPFRRPK